MSSEPILEARDLAKNFGGVQAVRGASFTLGRGELAGLIGPNGAGKTTMFNLLSGALAPTSGQVLYSGEDITGLSTFKRAKRGLVRTFQIPKPFQRMTVLENTLVAGRGHPGDRLFPSLLRTPGVRKAEREVDEKAREVLDFVGLGAKTDTLAGHLSGGQRKLLEIARSLMLDPNVLLLDEPMAGVNLTLRQEILDRLKELHGRGLTLCVVEHDMDFVAQHCPRAIVMVQGRVLVDGPPDEVLRDPRVLEAYLGGDADDTRASPEEPAGAEDPAGGGRTRGGDQEVAG